MNHQVDTELALAIGREFARIFGHQPITKVLTIEASGIQFAMVIIDWRRLRVRTE